MREEKRSWIDLGSHRRGLWSSHQRSHHHTNRCQPEGACTRVARWSLEEEEADGRNGSTGHGKIAAQGGGAVPEQARYDGDQRAREINGCGNVEVEIRRARQG